VTACNDAGVWNESGASLSLVVLPAWWMTGWFRSAAVVLLLGIVLTAHVLRVRHFHRARAAQAALSRQLIASQEQERKRIAAGLHDTIGQNLLIIKNRALLGLQAKGAPTVVVEQLEEVSRAASQALEEVREVSYNLRPYQLDRFGLTKALQELVKRVADAARIPFHIQIDPVDSLLSAEGEINVYRIVQECLNNIVKHSNAATAHVTITPNDQRIRLVIEDDGCGFDYAALQSDPERPHSFGLSGLAERVRILNGCFRCDTTPGQGTRLIVELPILPRHERT
jgi:signal transduction histidine kinase